MQDYLQFSALEILYLNFLCKYMIPVDLLFWHSDHKAPTSARSILRETAQIFRSIAIHVNLSTGVPGE